MTHHPLLSQPPMIQELIDDAWAGFGNQEDMDALIADEKYPVGTKQLACGCRAVKIIEAGFEWVRWWLGCSGHDGASSGHILRLLNEQHFNA